MNVTLFYNEDHLQKAVAITNSQNPEMLDPMSLAQAEDELVAIMSENLDDLSIASLWGIFFIPQIITDMDEYDDVGVIVHIMIPTSYENKDEDLKSIVLAESVDTH